MAPTKKSRLYHTLIVAAAALIGLLLPSCTTTSDKFEVGARAPDFTLPTSDGDTVSLGDYRGKQPVLLYFHMAVG